ncbi:MAG: hypothetical protein CL764_01090 [Chloroflexi bacterium]|nr:hypothetical protein [Chloroflexota bacterium]|tara:strand:+ start:1116 stop:1766 length:651 start_codon:yes stop_codon:yes gene_type:complete
MNQIGNYKYPSISLNRAIEIVKVISFDFGGSIDRSKLASKLNMSPTGGQFSKVINGCKEWNLILGRSEINLTEFGVIVSNPQTIEENHNIKYKIIRSVNLFNEFFNKFPQIDIRDPNFHIYIQQITGVSRLELDSQYKYLKTLFSELIDIINQNNSYFNTYNIPHTESSYPLPNNNDEKIENNYIEIKFRDVSVRLPDNNDSVDAIIALLRAHKKI